MLRIEPARRVHVTLALLPLAPPSFWLHIRQAHVLSQRTAHKPIKKHIRTQPLPTSTYLPLLFPFPAPQANTHHLPSGTGACWARAARANRLGFSLAPGPALPVQDSC